MVVMKRGKVTILTVVLMVIAMAILIAGCGGGGAGGGAIPGGSSSSSSGGGGEQPPSGPPVITSLTPNSGQVSSSVQIAGNKFGPTKGSVYFKDILVPTNDVSSWTNNLIVAKVPTGATSGNVTVANSQGTSNDMAFTVTAPAGNPPTITNLNPTSGNVGSQTIITGTEFSGVTSVTFNGTAAVTYTVDSATQITATVPNGASTGPVVVTHPTNGASNGVAFTVTNPPTITGLNPTSGTVGSQVIITGTNFNGTTVTFNGVAASFTIDSPTQITATVPTGATTGNVIVTTTAGSSNGITFTVIVPPSWSFAWRKTGLNGPRNACFDSNNVICIAGWGDNNIVRYDTNGNPLSSIYDGSFDRVVSVATDANGNHFVGSYNTNKIQKFSSNWDGRVELITPTYRIRDIAAEYGNKIVVLESTGTDGWVEIFDADGTRTIGFTNPWQIASASTPLSIALSSDGNSVLIADSSAHYVRKYSLTGVLQGSYGGLGSSDGQFSYPDSIHVDPSGRIYVGDSGNFRFQVFGSNMTFYGKFTGSNGTGNGQFTYIRGIVSDSSGNVYTIDNTGNNIQKFTKN